MNLLIAPRLTYLDRTAWGARTDLPRLGWPVPRNRRTHVIIHHTVVVDHDATPNLWESLAEVCAKMRQLQTIRPDLGLDVPYSDVAFLMADGKLVICEGRGLDRTGAHTHGHNTAGYGLAVQGNFELVRDVTPWLALFSRYLGWLKYEQGMKNLGPIHGHKDFAQTACPGWHVMREINADRIEYAEEEEDMAAIDDLRRDVDRLTLENQLQQGALELQKQINELQQAWLSQHAAEHATAPELIPPLPPELAERVAELEAKVAEAAAALAG